jgi:predicted nucleic acid-binding protein
MPKTYIVDTSCLITLDKIGKLNFLRELYGTVLTTPEVVQEYNSIIPEWLIVQVVVDKNYQKILETSIDKGESSVIALGLSIPDSILVLDDLKARKYANRIGFEITGTLGIIYKAKTVGLIDKIKPFLIKLKENGFHISANIEDEILKLSEE